MLTNRSGKIFELYEHSKFKGMFSTLTGVIMRYKCSQGLQLFIAFVLIFWTHWLYASNLPEFTALVEKSSPSVVNISTVNRNDISVNKFQHDPNQLPDLFKHFFGDDFNSNPIPQEKNSLGSGFIISKDGYILTNNHVIQDAKEIIVRFSDRSELEAKLIGSDEVSDLALLKVDATNLPAVQIGESENLKVGEWVLAIGSPFGFDYSVTAGIVSAIGRSLPRDNYVPFIQTDVAINPGNSGGPLFNLDGQVVGINSQIYTRSGGFMGLSFAIPVDVAMEVVEQLKTEGRVSRGWLGVLIQEVNKDLAESFGLDKPAGALVAQVLADAPAEEAGIKEGDIIINFNGKDVIRSSDLPHFVGRTKAGKKVPVLVVRQGARQTITVEIGELPDSDKVTSKKSPKVDNRIGVYVEPLNKETKEKWNLLDGVIVARVGDGAGKEAGIREGDVITTISRQKIASVSEFEKVIKELPSGKPVSLRIVRKGSPTYLALKIKDNG